MTRLTRKVYYNGTHYGSPDGIPCDNLEHLEKVYTKLGQLEDIQEELGIDLIKYFKAVRQQNKYYCPNCNKMMDSEVVERLETLSVCGEVIQLKVKMRVCKKCGEPLADDELDDISLKQFYDEYRRRNNLLFPNEIKKIREKYNMSQTEFAKLLGMGAKTITRYENGTIQDKTHDNLIKEADNCIEDIRKKRRMKTLYVGFYDYSFYCQARELINNEFIAIDISEEDMDAINYYDCKDNKIEWYDELSDKVKQYDNIIVCEDGYYNLIDLTKLKKR